MRKRGAIRRLARRLLHEFGEDVRKVVESLLKLEPLAIVLFGSKARGRKVGGDVDLIVVKGSNLARSERQVVLYRLLPGGVRVDARWYTPRELALYWGRSTFINEVIREGIVVYELEEGALERAVEEEGERLEEGLTLEEWPLSEAKNWLKEAEDNLAAARILLEGGRYNGACFFAQQAAEKALKALIIAKEAKGIRDHEVSKILERASRHAPELLEFGEGAKFLDPLYVDTRYPDARGYRAFTKKEAERAISIAGGILEVVRHHLA